MSRLTFVVLALGTGAFALMQLAVVPVLPTIADAVGSDQHAVTWVLTSYLLAATVFTPIMGRLGDMFGKNRLLVVSLALISAGSLLAAAASSLEMMIIARAIAGAGAGVVPLSFGILRDECPPERMPALAGRLSALAGAGASVGMVVSGPIVDHLGHRWLFLIPGLIVGAAALAAALAIPRSPVRSPGRLPWLSSLLLACWLLPFLVAVSRAPEWGWTSPSVVGLLGTSLVALIAWWQAERRVSVPLIDLAILRRRGIWTVNLVGLTAGAAMFATFAILPPLLQAPTSTGYGMALDTTGASVLLLPFPVMSFVGGFLTGVLVRRVSPRTLVALGCLVSAVAMAALAHDHGAPWQVGLANGITGAGLGVMFACLSPLIFAAVPPEQSGVASGINMNVRSLGGAIGAAVIPSILAAQVESDGHPPDGAYADALLVIAILLLCAALCASLIPAPRRTGRVPAATTTGRSPGRHPSAPDLPIV